ncbi:MAG: sugar transferase [Lachnospiraceae bacterium]|nr:sugar transferase [Lachnospiraceae bacterium]
MKLVKWEELPEWMKCEEVQIYYNILSKKKVQLFLKRMFDVLLSSLLLVILLPVMLVCGIWIKLDSKGPVLFRQIRITQYGRSFYICKFRTMVNDAEKKGNSLTFENDSRITRVGEKIRKYRIDEIPQLFNVLVGDMTFVGTRPEVKKYVKKYTNEMKATLLLPAGITSEASIEFKDEDKLISKSSNPDITYIDEILPIKMKYNLRGIKKVGLIYDLRVCIKTVMGVLR